MKMRFLLLAGLLCGYALPASASEPCAEYSDSWLTCTADSDCEIDQTACYTAAAYNKASIAAVRAYNSCMRPMIRCMIPLADDKLKTVAVCRAGKCTAIKPEDTAKPAEKTESKK